MSFTPSSPSAGSTVTITVTSAQPHTDVRLTGTVDPFWLGYQTGGKGHQWLWLVSVTEAKTYYFSFYVGTTQLCTANSFTAS